MQISVAFFNIARSYVVPNRRQSLTLTERRKPKVKKGKEKSKNQFNHFTAKNQCNIKIVKGNPQIYYFREFIYSAFFAEVINRIWISLYKNYQKSIGEKI